MKKYNIVCSFRFTEGGDSVIGECNTIEEAKELCQKHINEVFKDDKIVEDLGPVNREGRKTKHVFAITGVRFLVNENEGV